VGNDSVTKSRASTTIEVADGCRFQIVYDATATAENDPVSDLYREGNIAHLGPLVEVARATLSPRDRVLDIGAHLGGFALIAAALGCEVLAIDASPNSTALLDQSVALNGFRKLHVLQAAVGDQSGTVEFSVFGPFGHIATPASGFASITVPAVRVDDVLDQRGWDDVRMVKLDVEGSEIRAIRGMRKLLQKDDAPLFYYESNTHTLGLYGETAEGLRSELEQLGYVIYEVHVGVLFRVRPGEQQAGVVVDFLAAKKLPPVLAAWEKAGFTLRP
jgi:FkbM family methyltransferase